MNDSQREKVLDQLAIHGPLERGDILQIKPDAHQRPEFLGCLLIVTEPKPWGAQGYIASLNSEGLFYTRVTWDDVVPTGGKAPFSAEGKVTGGDA